MAKMKPATDVHGKPYSRFLLFVTLIIGGFVGFLAGTMLGTAYPTFMSKFGIGASTVQWLSTGFMLVTGVMIPITAWLMNRFSSKLLYIVAMILFTVGITISYCANSFGLLLTGRLVSAVGAGVMTSLMQSIALTIFPVDKRGTIMGIVGLAVGMAPAIGPTLSGWIIDTFNWRMIFGILIPISIIDIIMAFFFMRTVLELSHPKIDVLSAVLSVIGFGSFLYGTSEAGTDGWGSLQVLLGLIIGAIFIALFCWRQIKLGDEAFLDIRLLKNWHFTIASILGSIARIALVGVELILPMYIQIVRGQTPFHSGLMLLPGALMMGLINPISGFLYDRMGAKKLAMTGLAILTLGTFNFITISTTTPMIEIIVLYAVRVVGVSFVMMPVNTAGMNALPLAKINDGTAVNNTLRQVSGAIGTAIFTTALTNVQDHMEPAHHLLHTAPLEYKHQMISAALGGYHMTFFLAFLFGVLGIIIAFYFKDVKRKADLPLDSKDGEVA
ncbi:MAG TPA: multidrug efflux MFS transporter [Candidatus Ligilactobacillus avistercoris]|nr:multidrug efflux MFS transporter [Candidatus Ligilactobacillus avistercoris]